MKKLIIVVIAVLSVVIAYPTASLFAAEASRMEKEELKEHLGEPGLVIIDVRAFTDWLLTWEKIKGAVREDPRDFDGWYGKYPKDKTIVLYCA